MTVKKNKQSLSHKNEKIELYTLSFKLLVVKHAKMSSIGAAEQKFGVDRKRIREWIQNESKIQNKVSSKNRGSFAKKLDGGGRKIKDMDLEEMLLEWITLQRSKNLHECHGNLFKGKPGYMQRKKLLVRAK